MWFSKRTCVGYCSYRAQRFLTAEFGERWRLIASSMVKDISLPREPWQIKYPANKKAGFRLTGRHCASWGVRI